MSSHHPEAHDTLMRDILTGGSDAEKAFASSELADCPECERTFAELRDKVAQLDDAGSVEQAELAAITAADAAPAAREDRVLDGLRDAMRTEFGPDPDVRSGWASLARFAPGLVGAAAAIWLAFVLFVPSEPTPAFDPDARLGTADAPQDLEPSGTVDAWGSFTWRGALPDEGYFVVRIYDADWNPIVESPRLFENRWTPPSTQPLPAAIHWNVSTYAPHAPRNAQAETNASARLR